MSFAAIIAPALPAARPFRNKNNWPLHRPLIGTIRRARERILCGVGIEPRGRRQAMTPLQHLFVWALTLGFFYLEKLLTE